jgi:regulator of RNase E activity RraA
LPQPFDKDIVKRFKRLYVGAVSDVLDEIGATGAMDKGIRPLLHGIKICGPAFTLRAEPTKDGVEATEMFRAIDSTKPGDVMVVDTGMSTDGCLFGELASTACKVRGVKGAVIDGFSRDTAEVKKMKFPLYSRGIGLTSSFGRLRTISFDVPINCGGVQVRPGDLILGDEDGVVSIDKKDVEKVLELATKWMKMETRIRRELLKRRLAADVFSQYLYHKETDQ